MAERLVVSGDPSNPQFIALVDRLRADGYEVIVAGDRRDSQNHAQAGSENASLQLELFSNV